MKGIPRAATTAAAAAAACCLAARSASSTTLAPAPGAFGVAAPGAGHRAAFAGLTSRGGATGA